MTSQNLSISPKNTVLKKTECSQRTESTMVEITFTWTIENVTYKCQNMEIGKHLKSDIFSANGDATHQWQLQCYPAGAGKEHCAFLSIFAFLLNPKTELTANVEFSVLNVVEGKFVETGSVPGTWYLTGVGLPGHTFSKIKNGWGFQKLLSHKDLLAKNSKCLKEGALTVQCKITYEVENSSPSRAKVPKLLETLDCRIAHHLGHLFDSGRMSDITFIVGRRYFKAHKIIMSARSSVFAGMFEIDGRVSPLPSLKIEDCEPEVFEAMLRFLYTDEVEETEEMAKKLLPIAQIYKLQLLQLKCEDILIQNISKINCAEMLLLADVHEAPSLKKDALNFIRRNSGDVIKTAGWQTLRQIRPQLGIEIFEFISS